MECRQDGLEKLFRGELVPFFLELIESIWERGVREAEYIKCMLEAHGAEPGSLLLELGVGNSRVTIPLARVGYRVVGVDASELLIGMS